jgi:hypothetical protein
MRLLPPVEQAPIDTQGRFRYTPGEIYVTIIKKKPRRNRG